jgi:hypothetical protein
MACFKAVSWYWSGSLSYTAKNFHQKVHTSNKLPLQQPFRRQLFCVIAAVVFVLLLVFVVFVIFLIIISAF